MNQHGSKDSKLLILAREEECFYFFHRLLDRNGLTTTRVGTGRQCLEAAARTDYDLIMARIPIPDLSVSALATGLAQRFSLNTETPLLLLAGSGQYEATLGYKNARVQVVNLDDPATDIGRLVTSALGIAMRTAARLDVEIEVETGSTNDRSHCRSRDISRSGMLLEVEAPLPIGTEFGFNFTLPSRFTPIHGRGQVVRHASEREPMTSGMGVKFIDFPEGAEAAIQAFVEQHRARAD